MKRVFFQVLAVVIIVGLAVFLFMNADKQDKLHEDEIALGVRYLTYELEGGPYRVDLLELDRKRAKAGLVSWRSGGLVSTTQQVLDMETAGRQVAGAVNADFFSFQTTLPIGNQVMDGVWVHGGNSRRSHVLVDTNGDLFFDSVSFTGSVTNADGVEMPLTGVNRHRYNGQAMFYNSHFGNADRSDSSGITIGMRLLAGEKWLAGDTLRMVVGQLGDAGMAMEEGMSIISVGPYHDCLSEYANIQIYDTLRVVLGFKDNAYNKITQVIGGGGRILRDGEDATGENVEIEGLNESFLQNRHPRTFVASNKSGTMIWLGTVDGRQAGSIGMNFTEMADFLKSIGAWNAVNLDGGGSTTMVVGGEIANRPSDANGERPVANILAIELKE
ncbi:MAG: phosphodiester glycosidase family protein [Balneolales bacterium]|nr:phosphodiester glycosidase family protein [Balneolales bacterium]